MVPRSLWAAQQVWRGAHGPFQELDTFLGPAGMTTDQAEQVQGLGVRRVLARNRQASGFGLCQPAGREAGPGRFDRCG